MNARAFQQGKRCKSTRLGSTVEYAPYLRVRVCGICICVYVYMHVCMCVPYVLSALSAAVSVHPQSARSMCTAMSWGYSSGLGTGTLLRGRADRWIEHDGLVSAEEAVDVVEGVVVQPRQCAPAVTVSGGYCPDDAVMLSLIDCLSTSSLCFIDAMHLGLNAMCLGLNVRGV